MKINDCHILYIEDNKDVIIGLKDFFLTTDFQIKYIHRYDDVRKSLTKIKPCLIIVDDDLNGRSRYTEIANEIKWHLMPSGKPVAYIGCTSEIVDLDSMKKKYKKEGYSDFLPNTGTEKDLKNMVRVMEKIILDM